MDLIPKKRMPDESGRFVMATCNDGKLSFAEYPWQEFDLDALQADEPCRVLFSVDRQGIVSANAKSDYWLIAAVDLPPVQYDEVDSGEKDEDGSPIITKSASTLKGEDIGVTVWALPSS